MKYFFYLLGFLFLIRAISILLPIGIFFGVPFLFLIVLSKAASQPRARVIEIDLNKPQEKEETIKEAVTIPPNNTVEGVLFWVNKVRENHRVKFQPELNESLQRSAQYLEKLQQHGYNSNEKILENITESLQNYDMLLNKEIVSSNVEQTLIQIENSFYNYETAFESMYHNIIDSELIDIETHTDVLNQQLKNNGLLHSDFEEIVYKKEDSNEVRYTKFL